MERQFNIGDLDIIRDIPLELDVLMKRNKILKESLFIVSAIGLTGFGIWIYRESIKSSNHEQRKQVF